MEAAAEETAVVEEKGQRAEPPDFERVALIMLSAVARMQGQRGLHIIVDVLRGGNDSRIVGHGFDELSVHGLLREMPRLKAVALMRVLLRWNLIARGEYSTLGLTAQGAAVMSGERSLPPNVHAAMKEAYNP